MLICYLEWILFDTNGLVKFYKKKRLEFGRFIYKRVINVWFFSFKEKVFL